MSNAKIKASAVTHLTDARYFAAWEVDWLGFVLTPGQDAYVDPRQLAAIREWVDGPAICGEFSLADADAIQRLADDLSLDAVQVDHFTDTDVLRRLAGRRPLLQELVIEGYSDTDQLTDLLRAHAEYVDYFLLNFAKGGVSWRDLEEGYPLSLATLTEWCRLKPTLLEIELGSHPPQAILDVIPAAGFSLRGGAEEKVGYKGFDELDEFFERWTVDG